MTIQMLAAWNGLEEDSVVSTLSSAEETRLVAAGLARIYTVGMDGRNPVFSNEQQAGLQGVVSGGANLALTYDGSGRLATAARAGGRAYTYAHSTESMVITASDGAVATVALAGTRVTGITGNF